jgi:hypothetical protein
LGLFTTGLVWVLVHPRSDDESKRWVFQMVGCLGWTSAYTGIMLKPTKFFAGLLPNIINMTSLDNINGFGVQIWTFIELNRALQGFTQESEGTNVGASSPCHGGMTFISQVMHSQKFPKCLSEGTLYTWFSFLEKGLEILLRFLLP